MIISFATPKHEKLANDYLALEKYVTKQKAHCTADDVLETLNALWAADSSFDLPHHLHPHTLFGNYKGHFAVWISKQDRIIFRPDHEGDPEFRIDNHKTIKRIIIVEICKDYHKR